MFEIIAFDADDTLWDNETLFSVTEEKFSQLLSKYHPAQPSKQKLYETELRNLQYYGYGIKSFTLSMIEAAVELTEGRIEAGDILEIIKFAKEMLTAEIQLLSHVQETVARLSASYQLMIITKGDSRDQEAKVIRSGLGPYFKHIEIVSEKTSDTYKSLLTKYNIHPHRFLCVGNSLKSDVLPVLAIGGQAVYIPHHTTWAHEIVADHDPEQHNYFELEHIGLLPALLEELAD